MKVTRRYAHSETAHFDEFSCAVHYESYKFWFTYRVDKKTGLVYEDSRQTDGIGNINLFAYELKRFADFIRQYPCKRLKLGTSESLGYDACDEFDSLQLFECF